MAGDSGSIPQSGVLADRTGRGVVAILVSIDSGLWAGPWLRDVSGLDKLAAANCLFWVAVAMVAGFLGMGQLAYRLTRHGIPPLAVSASGMALFMGVQLAILLDWGTTAAIVDSVRVLRHQRVLSYAVLSQSFPRRCRDGSTRR